MTQWHHSFLGLGPGHSRRRGRQLNRAQPGAGGECPPDTPGIGFTSVLFGAAVSWRHIWMLGGCAATPWSCAAWRLPAAIDYGFCVASCRWVMNVHCTCPGLPMAGSCHMGPKGPGWGAFGGAWRGQTMAFVWGKSVGDGGQKGANSAIRSPHMHRKITLN